MTVDARLVQTTALPAIEEDHDVSKQWFPDRLVVMARTDTRLLAWDLDRVLGGDTTPVIFPVPWPRRVGTCTVSPDLSFAVFAGVHAVQAFGLDGQMLWEVRHSCWEASCLEWHTTYEQYAQDRNHRYPEQGSACVSVDGKLVWAHVRGWLPGDERPFGHNPWLNDEQWLVLDAATGALLARIRTETDATGSYQLPHPDPARMALYIGEGQNGSVTWLGRYSGGHLEGVLVGRDVVLVGLTPSGHTLVSTGHEAEDELSLRRYADGSLIATVRAGSLSEREDPCWEYTEIGAVDERTFIAAVEGEHWLIDAGSGEVRGPVRYPGATPDSAFGVGRGRWLTPSGQLRWDVWQG